MDGPIKGIDRRPYAEVDGYEKSAQSERWAKGLLYLALGGIALKGTQIASNSLTVTMDPTKLSYLHEGLSTSDNPWWKVAGLELDAAGKAKVRLKDFALEGVKRGEELLGGIPRTLGIFGSLSRSVFSSKGSRLRLTPTDLEGSWSHYETLLQNSGQKISPLDYVRGFSVEPHQGKPALFRVDGQGTAIGAPLIEDVDVQVRKWSPENAPTRFHHIIRDTDNVSDFMGAKRIPHGNESRFLVSKATGDIKIKGTARELLEPFLNVDNLEASLTKNTSPATHKSLRDAHVFAKRMSERYMRVLDQPLEFIEELVYGGPDSSRGLLKKAQQSQPYSFFKNVLGSGGDYKGSVVDLWGRHAARIGLIAGVAAIGYEAVSMVTKTVTGKDPLQLGGSVVAATQRTYAAASDVTGLTALNKYQEENAPGSGRFLAPLGFALSGYLTGQAAAAATNPFAKGSEMAWRYARQETHEVPGILKKVFSGQYTRGGAFGRIGAAIGGLLAAPFMIGGLGSSSSYSEVKGEQEGNIEVAVKKGRYWEMGRTDIEGEATQYYRPNWYARLQDDAFDDLQFGDMADRPFSRFVEGIIDPNAREKEFYFERPYPVSGPDTSGFGPLGTLWGATVGKVLKNTSYMHTDELSQGGMGGSERGEVVQYGTSASEAPDASLGGLGPTPATSPYSASFMAGEGAYKATEAAGLPGFIFTALKKKLTGEQDFGTQDPVLETFSQVGSIGDNFWDLSVGGGGGTTEAFRRLFPAERYQLQKVNPVKNEMASWLPGPESFTDFQHGDPYSSVPEGEYRLPGSGYASRFPELKGVAYDEYPDIHKYRILADVAPYSDEFKQASSRMESLASSGNLSSGDAALYQATQIESQERQRKINFGEHKGVIGGYWELLKKVGRTNPVEHLLPISPVHKTAGPLDAISEYEERNVWSTPTPSWGNPLEDFVKPAANAAGRMLGMGGIPSGTQENRDLTEYFDKLEYVKYKKLESTARQQGEGQAAFAYARKAEYTMFGADPYADVDSIEKVLPKQDRPYFKEFLAAGTSEEKSRILQAVPDYTRKFYTAQWQKQNYAALAAKGNLSDSEQQMVTQIEASRALEGQSASVDEWDDYRSGVAAGDVKANTFPDYVRSRRIEGYFDDKSPLSAPPTDWLGYDPGIVMDDVKLKVIENLGLDYHDFDLWESDAASVARKPYVEEAAQELLRQQGEDHASLSKSLTALKLDNLDIQIISTAGDKTRIVLDLDSDRRDQLDRELKKVGIRHGSR